MPTENQKVCACGCGESFTPKNDWQLFANKLHADRVRQHRRYWRNHGKGAPPPSSSPPSKPPRRAVVRRRPLVEVVRKSEGDPASPAESRRTVAA